jgi:hypothetical protein
MAGEAVQGDGLVLAEVKKIRLELRRLLYRHYDIGLANRVIELTNRLEQFAEDRGRRGFWLDIRDYMASEYKENPPAN